MGGDDLDTHFVDTNILVGHTVEWDRLGGTVGTYLHDVGQYCTIYSSPRAVKEALYVVRQQRRLAKKATEIVYEEYDRAETYGEIEHIKNFVYSELADGSGDTTGIGGVLALIEEKENTFEGLTKVDTRSIFDQLSGEIDAAFEEPIGFLEALQEMAEEELPVRLFWETATDYENQYPQYSGLADIFADEPTDRDLLFDAFHMLTTMGLASLRFVTDDRDDFISNRDRIQESLPGIVISRPDEVTAG